MLRLKGVVGQARFWAETVLNCPLLWINLPHNLQPSHLSENSESNTAPLNKHLALSRGHAFRPDQLSWWTTFELPADADRPLPAGSVRESLHGGKMAVVYSPATLERHQAISDIETASYPSDESASPEGVKFRIEKAGRYFL